MFDEEFLRNLPDDNIFALEKLCQNFFENPKSKGYSQDNYDEYLQAFGTIYPIAKEAVSKLPEISFGANKRNNFEQIVSFFNYVNDFVIQYNTNKLVQKAQNDFQAIRGKIVYYEFQEDDFEEIQNHINELRIIIDGSELLSEDHKLRLLKRLEKVQLELHKRVSDVDRFLGLLLDVNIIVRDLGENAKPFMEITKNISKIITQLILVQNGIPPSEMPKLLG